MSNEGFLSMITVLAISSVVLQDYGNSSMTLTMFVVSVFLLCFDSYNRPSETVEEYVLYLITEVIRVLRLQTHAIELGSCNFYVSSVVSRSHVLYKPSPLVAPTVLHLYLLIDHPLS